MFLLVSRGPYRDLARIIVGALLIVIGAVVKTRNPHYILMIVGAVLIVWGVLSGLSAMRKRGQDGTGGGQP
jgi:uncharacterized membrane protein HdeD (DUF308 family)